MNKSSGEGWRGGNGGGFLDFVVALGEKEGGVKRDLEVFGRIVISFF